MNVQMEDAAVTILTFTLPGTDRNNIKRAICLYECVDN
jgi:hypothetical protein